MKTTLISLLFLFFLSKPTDKQRVIYIQPLGNVEYSYLEHVKKSINGFYGFEVVVRKKVELSDDLLSPSGKRYDALKILKKFRSKENILVVTEKDIITDKNGVREWGILGLGFRPGSVCVISTIRIKKNVSNQKFLDRLTKIAIHEIGHNLGLDHCNYDEKCLMNDARGTISQVDKETLTFCKNCRRVLN